MSAMNIDFANNFVAFQHGWILAQTPAGQGSPRDAAPGQPSPAPAGAPTGQTGTQAPPDGPPAPPPQPGILEMFMPMVFMFAIFYFLLIRPQQKKQREHQKLIESVKTGDKVVTNSGIHGLVANVKERTIMLKVADNVKIELDRAAIATITRSDEAA